jgi:pimeloyl-ACP methyl ester carboxylesterase
MALAAAGGARALAIDLPGIGESTGDATDGTKRHLAAKLRGLVAAIHLEDVTLVGHDIGGMVVHAYLRAYGELRAAVVMDVFVPGIAPWDDVIRNPDIWHLAMHAVNGLPETLVRGRQGPYFDYFYGLLSLDPAKVTPEARAAYVRAYATDAALTASFDWYQAFARDVAEDRAATGDVTTPVLYLRGQQERSGDIGVYTKGLEAAGVRSLQGVVVPGARHFTQEEEPAAVWEAIASFAARAAP